MSIYTECNVRGTQMLLDAARRATRLRRFVHVSTTDVYGYPSVPCCETGALKDAGLPYNRTKILAEKAVWGKRSGTVCLSLYSGPLRSTDLAERHLCLTLRRCCASDK